MVLLRRASWYCVIESILLRHRARSKKGGVIHCSPHCTYPRLFSYGCIFRAMILIIPVGDSFPRRSCLCAIDLDLFRQMNEWPLDGTGS